MSNEFSKFAWSKAVEGIKLTATERGVLMVLFNHADENGRDAYPSQATIAGKVRCSSRSVIRALAALRERGLIHRDSEGRKHVGSAVYRLTMPSAQGDISQGDIECQGDNPVILRVTPVSPKHIPLTDPLKGSVPDPFFLGDTSVTPEASIFDDRRKHPSDVVEVRHIPFDTDPVGCHGEDDPQEESYPSGSVPDPFFLGDTSVTPEHDQPTESEPAMQDNFDPWSRVSYDPADDPAFEDELEKYFATSGIEETSTLTPPKACDWSWTEQEFEQLIQSGSPRPDPDYDPTRDPYSDQFVPLSQR